MRQLLPILAVSALVLSTAPAYADFGDQLFKLLPDDGEEGDVFGNSVSISGTTAIVGARFADPNGSFSGSAYLFDITTGQQIAKLLPNDGAGGDQFGRSVGISGTTAIVGAWENENNGRVSGSAYLFDATTGQQIAKLLPNDGAEDDYFGFSVAISGTTAIVGAFQNDDNGYQTGSAYLFDTTTGQQTAKLLPDVCEAGRRFGISTAISGTTAIVGAEYDDDNANHSGAAYLFAAAGAPNTCPWDFDGDGNVGAFDLAIVLGFWGPNIGHPAELDCDGEIGASDLALLLGNWGPCR